MRGASLLTSRSTALPAMAIGAAAVGAVALGALAIGRLAISSARIRSLEIDELTVHRHDLSPMPRHNGPATDLEEDGSDFDHFLEQRKAAADAYVSGNSAPVDALSPTAGDVTFHSPRGDTVSGAAAVSARYEKDAASFKPGGSTRLETLHKQSDRDLAFWTGFQIAIAQLADQDEPVEMRIRVTEVFRRINGAWKMVHRHADMCRPRD